MESNEIENKNARGLKKSEKKAKKAKRSKNMKNTIKNETSAGYI